MIDRALEEQESSQRAWITYWGSDDRSGKASASLRLTVERRYIGRGDKINFQVGSPREITKYDLKAEKLKRIQWPCYATQNKKKLLCKTDRTEWRSLIHSGLCTEKKGEAQSNAGCLHRCVWQIVTWLYFLAGRRGTWCTSSYPVHMHTHTLTSIQWHTSQRSWHTSLAHVVCSLRPHCCRIVSYAATALQRVKV